MNIKIFLAEFIFIVNVAVVIGIGGSVGKFVKNVPSLSFLEGRNKNTLRTPQYLIPSPQNLPTMPDYTDLVSKCNSAKDTNCRDAMNQFAVDSDLMVPDSLSFINDLQSQTNVQAASVTDQQNGMNVFSGIIDGVRNQLISVSDSWTAQDAAYSQSSSDTSATISNILSPSGNPIYVYANSEKQGMIDQLTAMATAAFNYVSSQTANTRSAASTIANLYKNDRDVVGSTVATRLAAVNVLVATLVNDIGHMRGWWASNVTAEQSNLQNEKATEASAKVAAEAKGQAAMSAMQSAVGIDAAMANVRAAYLAQVSTTSGVVTSLQNSAYQQLDAAAAAAGTSDAAMTASLQTSLKSTQTTLDSVQTLLAARVAASTNGRSAAQAAIAAIANTNSQQISNKIKSLNSTMDAFLKKNSDVSSSVFADSQTYMTKFANLASDAASSAGLASAATGDGSSLSSLNGYIGGMAGGASATSEQNAQSVSASIASSRQYAAQTTVGQILAIADAITTITALFELVKAKSGQGSDKADMQLNSVQNSVAYSLSALQATLDDVVASVSAKVNKAGGDAKKFVANLVADAAQDGQDIQGQLSAGQAVVNGKISAASIASVQAGTAADAVVTSGAALASTVANSNDHLASLVTGMKTKTAQAWTSAHSQLGDLKTLVRGASRKLQTRANRLLAAEQARAKLFVNDTQVAIQTAVKTAQTNALLASNAALAARSSESTSIIEGLTNSSHDVSRLMDIANRATNEVMNTLGLVPAVLTSSANSTVNSANTLLAQFIASAMLQIAAEEMREENLISNATNAFATTTSTNNLTSALAAKSQLVLATRTLMNGFNATLNTTLLDLSLAELRANLTEAQAASDSASSKLEAAISGEKKKLLSFLNSADMTNSSTLLDAAVTNVQAVINGGVLALTNLRDNLAVPQQFSNWTDEIGAKNAEFNAFLWGKKNLTNLALASFANASDLATNRQTNLTNQMDALIQAMTRASGSNTAQMAALQAQFAQLKSSSSNIPLTLNAALANGVNAATSNYSSVTQTILGNQQTNLAAMGSLTDQLLAAMTQPNANSSDPNVSLLAASLESLSAGAQAQVRAVLEQIESGELTVNDVIAAKSHVEMAQLLTAEDLVLALADYARTVLVRLKLLYGSDVDHVNAFLSSATALAAENNATRKAAVDAARHSVEATQKQFLNFQKSVNSTMEYSVDILSSASDHIATLRAKLPAQLLALKQQANKAISDVEAKQDALAASLVKAAAATQDKVVQQLSKQNKKSSFTNNVTLPTNAPPIALIS